jgi:Skp family chaperone for outer membrane proteins
MKKSWGKSVFVGVSILAVCAMFLALQPTPTKVRVGTFDSRAVAIAYARSAMFAPVMKELKDKYEKAKAEKNEQVIKELEAWAPTHHKLQMLQAFSIASVADILEKVKDNLPKAAQEAGVDMIVSKWEVPYKNPSIETVDVTSHLVKFFNPDEQTLKIIEELSKQPPMPLLEALLSKEE